MPAVVQCSIVSDRRLSIAQMAIGAMVLPPPSDGRKGGPVPE